MTVLRFLLLIYALLAIFIAGGLFFRRSGQAYLLLSFFVFLFGIELLHFLYATSKVVYLYPHFFGRAMIPLGLLYGPILYFHFRYLLHGQGVGRKDLLHFIPAVASVILFADVIAMPDQERMEYMRAHFFDRIMPLNYAKAVHVLIYGIVFIVMLYRHLDELIPWKKIYAITICAIYFVTAVFVSWLTEYADHWRQFIYYYLGVSTMVFSMGLLLYTRPDFLENISRKYLTSSLSEEEMKRIQQKLSQLFEKEKIYLQRELSLAKVAQRINEKSPHISQTLSTLMELSFNDFLNKYRIERARQLLKDQAFEHYKIEAIGLESGFANKVTFNRAFTKFTAMTPSEYKKKRG